MIRLSIFRPVAVSMAYATIAALGVLAWRNIPIELLPDASLPQLTVSAGWQGSSPEVVEAFLTSPLEAEIQQVRGVERIESTSTEGSTSITVVFALDTDMDFARMELSERLSSLRDRLPLGASIPLVTPYVPDEFEDQLRPLLLYTVTGPYTLETIREYVIEEVQPDLEQIQGVGVIQVRGGRARVLQIDLDRERIESLGLTPAQVSAAVRGLEIVEEAGAVITTDGTLRTLAIRERAETVDDVRNLPLLTDATGRLVRVDDVGRVYETYEEARSHYRIDGFPAVSMSLYKSPRVNSVRTADMVKTRMEELQQHFPQGVRMILDADLSTEIRAQLSDLRNRAAISAVIVLLVLLLFLRSIRAAIVVFATVAFAILITLNFIYFGGLTLNVLTLMGLAMGFGLVVDNAIVVLENIYRHRRLGADPETAAQRGAREVIVPILAATGTTVVVVIPFVYLQGELRIYYVPLAIVVGLSLIASLFVAFSFIPALGARLLKRIQPLGEADRARIRAKMGVDASTDVLPQQDLLVVRLYSGLIRGSLRYPWATVALSVLMLGGSYYLFDKYVNRGIVWGRFGGGEDTYIDVGIRQPRGEELERTDDLVRYFEDRIRRMPEVEQFVSNVSAQTGRIHITFPDSLEYTQVPVAIKEQLVQFSLLYGGAEVRVTGYGPSFYGGGGSSAPNYSIKILGYNYEEVRVIAEGLADKLRRYSRIREVDTNSAGNWYQRDRATEIVLDIDRTNLALHDLTATDVVSYVGATVRGATGSGGNLRIGGDEMRIDVKLEDYDKMDMQRLEETLIPASTGGAVRLGDIATVRERQTLNQVIRENQQYQRIVSYEFRGPNKLGDRVRDAVIAATALPPGYTIEERASYYWSAEEQAQIWGVLGVSVILILMVTAALFESLKQPLCVLLTVPMALIGVFLLFFYTNANFTREAYIGVIMMAGIVVNNAILLVDHVNQLRRNHGMLLHDAVLRGTIERVRPILMTSLTTICGLLPLVLFAENVNANIWNALGFALIGGLASSTVLVLTVTPALYLLFERRAERKRLARLEAAAAPPAAGDLQVAPA
jgi:hydrophobic/amphiphilic exporter-1 (mainly G- bacteria), HAE1 family